VHRDRVEDMINATKKAVRDSGGSQSLAGSTSEIHPAIMGEMQLPPMRGRGLIPSDFWEI